MGYLSYGRQALQHILKNASPKSSSYTVVNPLLYACQGLRYRKLEVILTTNIDKLGKAGETVKVAPGYFRNHLMPKLLAVPNIDKFAYLIREQRKIYQPVDEEQEEEKEEVKVSNDSKEFKTREYEKAALRLTKAKLVLRRFIDAQKAQARSKKDDPLELRSAVMKDEIVAEVARQLCVNIAPENLHLPTPLSQVGEYEVPLLLPRSIPCQRGHLTGVSKLKFGVNKIIKMYEFQSLQTCLLSCLLLSVFFFVIPDHMIMTFVICNIFGIGKIWNRSYTWWLSQYKMRIEKRIKMGMLSHMNMGLSLFSSVVILPPPHHVSFPDSKGE